MEFNKLKISYLVVALDKTLTNVNKSYLKLLLTDDLSVPSIIIDDISNFESPLEALRRLHDEYIKYNFEFPIKQLCDVRFVGNICEITYLITLNYVPKMNKKGRLFSLREIQERNIEIEEYYGKNFVKSGANIFRQFTSFSDLVR